MYKLPLSGSRMQRVSEPLKPVRLSVRVLPEGTGFGETEQLGLTLSSAGAVSVSSVSGGAPHPSVKGSRANMMWAIGLIESPFSAHRVARSRPPATSSQLYDITGKLYL